MRYGFAEPQSVNERTITPRLYCFCAILVGSIPEREIGGCMGRIQRFFASAVMVALLILFTGCTKRAQFYFNENVKLDTSTPITITTQDDATGTRAELQILLQKEGFQIYSPVAGKKTRTLDQESKFPEINSLRENKSYTQQEYVRYGSKNVLTLTYGFFMDDNHNYFYNSFFAEIANSETGAILMSAHYPDGRYRKSGLLKDLVRRMGRCAKQGLCNFNGKNP